MLPMKYPEADLIFDDPLTLSLSELCALIGVDDDNLLLIISPLCSSSSLMFIGLGGSSAMQIPLPFNQEIKMKDIALYYYKLCDTDTKRKCRTTVNQPVSKKKKNL